MSTGRFVPGPRVAWLVVAVTAVAAGLVAVDRDLRSSAAVVSSVVAVGMILLGVAIHRPRSAAWPLLALMLGFWAVGGILVHVEGGVPALAVVCVWAGHGVALGVTLDVVLAGARPSFRSVTAGLDLVIIAVVLALVGAQVVRAGTAGATNPTAVVVSGVDVALLGMLVRFSVSRRGLVPSNVLVLMAAFLAIVYDLTSAVHGRRVARPGEAGQVVGCTRR